MTTKAVFLDRDGVLVPERGEQLVTRAGELRPLPGVWRALRRLGQMGYWRVVVTNQAVVARGWITEGQLEELHRLLNALLGGELDAFYFCPHHPKATLERYRGPCACRKPGPGLLRQAAEELGLDLARCGIVGDRGSDLAAGEAAGCAWTALVQSEQPQGGNPTVTVNGLAEVADWLEGKQARR
jgi:D-glycero-D-manno-heptose 1,7-bisphosphate phosphatase